MNASPDVTALLAGWCRGDEGALDRLLPHVYAELRRIAARQLRREPSGGTLQPTALVHEVYLRLVDQHQVDWQSRAHFFGVAARVMRRILVDKARRRGAAKRGNGMPHVSIDAVGDVEAPPAVSALALDEALTRLATLDSVLARVVELRTFGGLTTDEVACVLNVSPTTVKRDWRAAKAWLARALDHEAPA